MAMTMTKTKAKSVDMSEEAIAARLEQVRALYKLMVSLKEIRVEDARKPRK